VAHARRPGQNLAAVRLGGGGDRSSNPCRRIFAGQIQLRQSEVLTEYEAADAATFVVQLTGVVDGEVDDLVGSVRTLNHVSSVEAPYSDIGTDIAVDTSFLVFRNERQQEYRGAQTSVLGVDRNFDLARDYYINFHEVNPQAPQIVLSMPLLVTAGKPQPPGPQEVLVASGVGDYVCMRSPAGEEHWTRGTFIEVTPHTRLVIDMHVTDSAGEPLFRAYTEVDFADALGGTQMDVVQTYTFIDPSIAAPMVTGAPEGWRTTLDKLEKVVVRMQGGAETGVRSVAHASFHLERTYDAPVARVWKALTDKSVKQEWFGGTPGHWELLEQHMDVRVGGSERVKSRWAGGVVSTPDATYHDVIPNERLVYSYEMHLDDKKISVSLATMQLKAEAGKTTLMVIEQGAFLDGYDDAGAREQGTKHLLDALGASLKV
jgi:uncharacterized protein YndB with AHSA1/START domain